TSVRSSVFLQRFRYHRPYPSSPTRRSSDLYTIPPLSNYEKLPVEAIAKCVWQQLQMYLKTERFSEAGVYLTDLLKKVHIFPSTDRLRFMAVAVTLEFFLVLDTYCEKFEGSPIRLEEIKKKAVNPFEGPFQELLKTLDGAYSALLQALYIFRGLPKARWQPGFLLEGRRRAQMDDTESALNE